MTTVFVTGARGLVGSHLCDLLTREGYEVRRGDLPDCNVTIPELLEESLGNFDPDWIVNLAAFTNVDECERVPMAAEAANAEGALHVARLASARGARLLQVSTDYVFDGRKAAPYGEEDPVNPLSAYGRSKLKGERHAREAMGDGNVLIVRGQSLYGRGRKSFPDSIRRIASEREEIPVVTDQVVSPTWARHFAEGLRRLMDVDATGVFHLSSSGSCTWNEFARAVLEEDGGDPGRIKETNSSAFGRPAPRPSWSVFDLSKFIAKTGWTPTSWRAQLREYAEQCWRAA